MRRINLIKTITIFFFAIAMAFVGCNDDLYQHHNHNHESNFSAKKLSPEEALQVARKLNGLVNNGKHNTLLISEQSLSVANNSVDFSTVNLIESINGTKTYAFAVNDSNLEDNIIKNVILQEFQNEIVVKEVSYNMTDSFKQQYYNGATNFKSFQGTVTFETVFGNPCPDDADPVSIGIPVGDDNDGNGGSGYGGYIPIGGIPEGGLNGGYNNGGIYGGSGSGGGGGGYAYLQCTNCSRTYGSRSEMDGSICAGYNYIIVISFGQNQNVVPNNSPCDPSTTLPVAEQEFFFKSRDFQRNLTPEQRTWTQQNPTSYTQILNYLRNENWSNESEVFAKWAINFMINNPTVTWRQFQNWFLTPREGQDYIYDSTYWENPSLTFPQQNLPTFQNFDTNYPRMNGEQLAQLVGGDVLNLYNQYPSIVRGFCALKVSRALNYSGVTIPNITTSNGNPGTVLGGDGKYYFLNAKALNKWMQKTFGVSPTNSNHIKILGSQGGENGGNFPTLTAGIKGIYSMVSSNPDWASGHADLINEGICVFGCHFYDNPPAPIDYIDIWILN